MKKTIRDLLFILILVIVVSKPALSATSIEGPIQSLDCLARAVYWEARGEPYATKVQEALYIIDISKSGRPNTGSVCTAAYNVSNALKLHLHEAPSGQAWDDSQRAALLAWENPKLDKSQGQGAYFIDIQRLTRPGFKTVFVEQLGTVLFFKEVPDGANNK